MPLPDLNQAEHDRYARHLSMPQFGAEGQRRLKHSAVLCIGTGGLGSPALMYLAAAGVGRIGLVDADSVERSNLQRQIVHGESSLGQAKTDSAAARLRDINPHVEVITHQVRFGADNAAALIDGYDMIIDGSDNFPTRFLTNDICYFSRIPNIYGSIHQFEGQLSVFAPHLGGPCLRCMLPALPPADAVPSCAEAGVLGVLPGVIGTLQAIEAIKLLANLGQPAIGRLIHFDALALRFRELRLARDPDCALCGPNASIHSPANPETRAQVSCASAPDVPEVDVTKLRARLDDPADAFLLVDIRTSHERALAAIDGSIHVALADLGKAPASLEPEREIVLICAGGVRSVGAARRLREAGFRNVAHVTGGIREWIANDFPVLRG